MKKEKTKCNVKDVIIGEGEMITGDATKDDVS